MHFLVSFHEVSVKYSTLYLPVTVYIRPIYLFHIYTILFSSSLYQHNQHMMLFFRGNICFCLSISECPACSLQEMAKILNHPRVYAFLHVPVQSASDSVLMDMKREYCVDDFKKVVDFLKERWDTTGVFFSGQPTVKLSLSLLSSHHSNNTDFTQENTVSLSPVK